METDIQKLQATIEEQHKMIAEMYVKVDKLYKYFKWTMIITIVLFVVPLILLVFAIPSFLHNYLGPINSLNNSLQ